MTGVNVVDMLQARLRQVEEREMYYLGKHRELQVKLIISVTMTHLAQLPKLD